MTLLMSGTSAAHYITRCRFCHPSFEVILNANIALSDNPTPFLFSLSESAVKD